MPTHIAVWIDHREARVFHVDPNRVDEETLKAHRPVHHQHPLGADGVQAHPEDDRKYFTEVARVIEAADSILIVGPSTAKLQFIKYIHQHEKNMVPKIVGEFKSVRFLNKTINPVPWHHFTDKTHNHCVIT